MSSEKKAVVRSKYTNFPTSDGKSREAEGGFVADEIRMGEFFEQAEHVRLMLQMNHEAIEQCAILLNKSQPPMRGKIEIRWWGKGGQSAQPTVVLWGEKKGFPEVIKPVGLTVKAGKRGSFQNNYDDTCRLLGITQDLMESRSMLIKYMADFKRMTTRYNKGSHEALLRGNKAGIFRVIEARIDKRAMEESEVKPEVK